jgi:two-component system, LuxR family, response regulator FixJ
MSEIFIKDDDSPANAALTTALRGAGFDVVNFVDGESFLIAARKRTPDCILIDTYLPGCPGLEALKRLETPQYPAPVAAISGAGLGHVQPP